MRKKTLVIFIVISLFFISVTAVLLVLNGGKKDTEATFSEVTECVAFQTIPLMQGEDITWSKARDVGQENFVMFAENSTHGQYKEYLTLLEQKGYQKVVDNGEDGLVGAIYCAQYSKEEKSIYVVYFANLKKTMVNVYETTLTSPHLFYDETSLANNIEGRKTTFYMPELYGGGNSFVFQLKNGHYIINDGATRDDLPYLLDYLEEHAPNGEKPVVDAWFISHAHADHNGFLQGMMEEKDVINRVAVESFYFNAPGNDAIATPSGVYDNIGPLVTYGIGVSSYLKNSKGEATPLYRPRVGERLYINDITIDVVYTQEFLEPETWDTWNSSTTMLMYTVEGQKVFITGDADWECQKVCMEMLDNTYFDLDIYQAPHHGINVYKEIVYSISNIDTIIYPTQALGSAQAEEGFIGRAVQNAYLRSRADEAVCWGDGAKLLTFPYEVGTYEAFAPIDWKYQNHVLPKWRKHLDETNQKYMNEDQLRRDK